MTWVSVERGCHTGCIGQQRVGITSTHDALYRISVNFAPNLYGPAADNRYVMSTKTVQLDVPDRAIADVDEAVEGGFYDDRESALQDAVLGFFGGYDS